MKRLRFFGGARMPLTLPLSVPAAPCFGLTPWTTDGGLSVLDGLAVDDDDDDDDRCDRPPYVTRMTLQPLRPLQRIRKKDSMKSSARARSKRVPSTAVAMLHLLL